MKAKPVGDPLVIKMDAFAAELLAGAKEAKVSPQQRIDVFRAIREWVSVKNRLAEPTEGSDLDAIRNRLIYGQSEIDSGTPSRKRAGAAARVKWGTQYPGGTGGSALEAIKRALPRPPDSDVGNSGGNPEC